jgi:4-amino-4-deoxychorismate lyase
MLIDGVATDTVSASDRGLQYGDGLFETIAIHHARPLLWERHMQRLETGCRRLGIPCPERALLREESDRLCRGRERAVIKIIVTRGGGGRGYAPPERPQISRILSLHEWPMYPREASGRGIDAPVCSTRLARQPALAGLKHLNRLEQVLARGELTTGGAPEGIMLDTEGFVIEGTMSNLFAVHGTELWTPDLSACGVAGVVRAEVLERAAEWSLRAIVRHCTPDDIATADEAFVTNSIIGVWPLNSIGGRRLQRGNRAAEISRALGVAGLIVPQ